ncbi:unnamed protein product, partial [Candidula unifasciata]
KDLIGFGFVLQGSSPCYVLNVDPLGPAAAAGLQVRHFISSVNGQDVLTMNHQEVGLLLVQTNQITLTVLSNANLRDEGNRLQADSLTEAYIL